MHHRGSSLLAWRPHQQNEGKHRQKHYGEQPEDVIERHERRLLADDVLDHAIRHPLSGCGISTCLRYHHALHSIHQTLCLQVRRRYMRCEGVHVYLRVETVYCTSELETYGCANSRTGS